MKIRLCLFALLLTSVGATIVVHSQGEKKPRTAADYRVRTLSEMTTLQPDYIAKSPDYKPETIRMVVHADPLPSRIKVVYDGATRPVLQTRQRIITEWANKFAGMVESYTVPYDTEMLFAEEGKSYWLVVKKEFVPRLEQEFKKGDLVELFLIKLGNAIVDERLEPVLLVERFDRQ